MEEDLDNFNKEVYIAYGLDNEVLYVGQGNIGRSSHCSSGASHNRHLNRYYFLNGEGDCIKTEVYKYTMCEAESVNLERILIDELSPKYNTVKQPKSETYLISSNFKYVSEKYYDIYTNKKHEVGTMSELDKLKTLNKDFGEIVDVIGIDEIKNTGFHKTKSKTKYKKIVGINEITKSKASAFRNLKVRKGDFLPYSEIKDRLQRCFDKLGLDTTAKATDIKEVYNVKRTARQGVEGFLIGERL